MAQQAAPAPSTGQTTTAAQPSAQSVPSEEEVITLSPFTVDSSTEKGFFAQNTLAGSRMNTNVADLASAISVVTKQQLEDTGSLDINDIFRYEIGTEGSTTYTPTTATMRGDGVADAIGGATFGNSTTPSTNATANRVRGLGSPTMALNYYPAISAVPFDSYNTQSVEISRGPNSMLFGMGSPAGIVNQSTAKASLNKDANTVAFRTDDRGSKRTSFSFNKVLLNGKLAIYGAALYNDQQFERKPSYDITRRQYAAITFKPFKGTTISANVERYNNDNRRPNTLTPLDTVTQWRAAGMPVYDNLTKKINYLGSNTTSAIPYLLSANAPGADDVVNYLKSLPSYKASLLSDSTNKTTGIRTVTYGSTNVFSTTMMTSKYLTVKDSAGKAETLNPLYVQGIIPQSNGSRTFQRIDGGNQVGWYQQPAGLNYVTSWGANSAGSVNVLSTSSATASNFAYGNSTWSDVFQRQVTSSANYNAPDSFVMSSYRYPGVTDKSIYDWENINVSQANFGNAKNTGYNVELEQEIIPGLLNFSAGWFRQDYNSMSSYTIAQLNTTTLFVDTNKYNIDGTVNPYMGQVYVEDYDPDRYRKYETVDNYRAMLAFTPDFTKNDNWTKWFGRHQILGLASYMDDELKTFRDRLEYTGGSYDGILRFMKNQLADTAGNPTGWSMTSQTSIRRQYYLSSPGDSYGTVTHSSGPWDGGTGSGQIYTYDYGLNSFKNVDVTTDWVVHDSGTQINQRLLTSYSGGWTSYLWNDRIVGTLGIRRDINRTRVTTNGATSTESTMTNAQKWVNGVYQYETVFDRWTDWSRVMGTTKTVGAVVKPFQHWGPISRRAASGNLFWEIVDSLGVSANKSDNFDAPTGTYVDFFGKKLPKPEGTGKDYGIQFSAFKNKLFVRVNWFDSTNENSIMTGTPKTAMDRLSDHIDTTAYRSWLENIYVINQGYDPTLTDWRKDFDNNPANTTAMQTTVGQWWGLNNDYNYYSNLGGTTAATGNTKAKGTEIEINYNPLPNWTIRFTGSKVKTTNSNLLKEFDAWLAVRMPVWQNAKATDFLAPQYAYLADGYYLSGATNKTIIKNFWSSTNYNGTIKSDSASGWYTPEAYYASVVTPQYALGKDLEGQQVMNQRKYNWSLLSTYTFDHGKLKGFSIGGAERWSDKSIIGYYGKASGADSIYPNKIDMSDTTRPIYDDAMWYTDLWVGYTTKIMKDKVRMKLQLNVNDVFQDGELKPVAVNYDGSVSAYRIVDPRTFVFSATFSF